MLFKEVVQIQDVFLQLSEKLVLKLQNSTIDAIYQFVLSQRKFSSCLWENIY